MKIISVVGARPQFIKLAGLLHSLEGNFSHTVIHTGQHYDNNMSQLFFDELELSPPAYNLGVGSDSHSRQTAAMMVGLEETFERESPDGVLVYGDTNSTLAGALTASKMHIPVAHIESGLRSFNRRMPEEINRIVADHISDALFAPTPTAMRNLEQEGLLKKSFLIGDVMLEGLRKLSSQAELHKRKLLASLGVKEKQFALATIHRAENTDYREILADILDGLSSIDYPFIFPMHPRTRKRINEFSLENKLGRNIQVIEPVGYLEMFALESSASVILTDSGGIQKESWALNTPCVTIRDETEWVETVESGANKLSGRTPDGIKEAFLFMLGKRLPPLPDFFMLNPSELIPGILKRLWG